MSEVKAKELMRQVINELANLYDDVEANAMAMRYLHDRFHADRMKIALNAPIHIDQKLLDHDLNLLKIGTPLQHVVGFTEFYGHRFKCDPNALIPRPETEELVDWVLEAIKELGDELKATELHSEIDSGSCILDIGTGTGCIPISISLARAESEVWGYDVSDEALTLARENSRTLRANTKFQQHDILAEALTEDQFDIIISNPPYIPWKEKADMHTNVVAHDPELALFVPDEDPLLFYRVIAEKAKVGLKQEGLLFFEIHEGYGDEVMRLLSEMGYQEIILRQDLNGKDRMIKAQLK